jgi:hypothetical protein
MNEKNKFEFFGYVIADDKVSAENAFRKYEKDANDEEDSNGGDDIDKNQIANDDY